MTISVKFLREETIENEAAVLLAAYSSEHTTVTTPPVPVDDILELYLGCSLALNNLQRILGMPKRDEGDILGAIFMNTKEVFIDESLDPEDHPEREGRYHFTVGHEIAHYQLHRHYVIKDRAQAEMTFPGLHPKPSVVCRKSRHKEPIEQQADIFSSCLLMPKNMVSQAWQRQFGNMGPYILDAEKLCLYELRDAYAREKLIEREFNIIAREFAPLFRVSVQAMRIRLEKLGLLVRNQTIPMIS